MKDIVAYSNPKSDIVKRYVDLKDSIVSLNDENMKIVMITAPTEEEGQAALAANLAVIMSKSGYNTLIIDCNIENSILDKVFEIKSVIGLTDFVLKDQSLDNILQNTELDNLKVIITGSQDIDIIGNKKIQVLLEECKKKFDYIIINGPSTLKGSGAQVLAKYCDGVVLVVEHEKTELEDIRKVQVKLEKFKEKILGVALNKYNTY